MKFFSPIYPTLMVLDEEGKKIAKFVEGEFETAEKKVIEILKGLGLDHEKEKAPKKEA